MTNFKLQTNSKTRTLNSKTSGIFALSRILEFGACDLEI